MSQQQQRRKPLLTVVVPGADHAPERSLPEPRRSLHGARRSTLLTGAEPYVRRLRALAWLLLALAASVFLLLQVVRGRARAKLPLVAVGLGPVDEQARTQRPR